jgi:signal transduction histidine kinase
MNPPSQQTSSSFRLKPKPFSIQGRLLLMHSLLLLAALWLLAASAAINLRAERRLGRALDNLHAEMQLRRNLENELEVMIAGARALLLTPELADPGLLPASAERMRGLYEGYLQKNPPVEERLRVAAVRAGFEAIVAAIETLERTAPNEQGTAEVLEDLFRRESALRHELLRWGTAQTDRLAATKLKLSGQAAALYAILAGFAVFSVASVYVLWRAQQRHLWAPLEAMRLMVLELKRGNLRVRAPHAESVELRPLADALGEMSAEVAEARHRLEQKVLERTAKLEEAQQQLLRAAKLSALGQLVAGVAHEVNNPLTSILGFSDVLLSRRDLDPRLRPQVETIRAEALRLKNVVSNLTGFSQQTRPRVSRFDLRTLLERLADLRAYQLQSGRIRLEIVVPATPLRVEGDADQLLQALFSIVLNAEQAIKAVREQGVIRIEANEEDGRCRVNISDDGIGMDAVTLKRIFEPFFTTRAAGQGTGMGLAVARGIVEQHGGEISAESSPGRGSTFRLTLPAAAPLAQPLARPHQPLAERGTPAAAGETTGRVLLVDDEPGILDLATHALAARGWQCTAVKDAAALPGAMEGLEFDIVLCDLRMPGASGLEVLRMLRRERPELARRFILMTGDPSEMAADAAEFASIELLRKPFTLARLYAAVEAAQRR